MTSRRPAALIRRASELDAPAIAELETAAWAGPLRAAEAVVRRRFAIGHTMLVADSGDSLAGAICFVETDRDPRPRDEFPRTFAEFSAMPRSRPVASLYTYNLCVRPEYRGSTTVNRLLDGLTEHARETGARWLVGDGRCPSYSGATAGTPDRVRRDPAFRAAVDRWQRTGDIPAVHELLRDPLLRFYHRTLGCDFLHLMPDFLPEDTASGGFRVIFAIDLTSQSG